MVTKSKTFQGFSLWFLFILPWVLGWLIIFTIAIAVVERLAS